MRNLVVLLLILVASPALAAIATITTKGMVCQVCAQAVQDSFLNQSGVTACEVNLETQEVRLTMDSDAVLSEQRIRELMDAAGFPALTVTLQP